jgi:hypothetical protein
METNYKAVQEIRDDIKTRIHEYIGTDIGELHHELYNTDYYIIGNYQAEQWLINQYGSVFYAIEDIKQYENDVFGEVNTDFSSPENIVNMIVYIIGENELNNCYNKLDIDYDSELTENIADKIFEYFE